MLLARRADIKSDDALLAQLDALKLRVLVRDTSTYAGLHLALLHPDWLRDGIDRSIELEWLARPLCTSDVPQPAREALYQKELAAMERLDIPRFDTGSWADIIRGYKDTDLESMGLERDRRVLISRLDRLSQADLARQRAVIKRSIAKRFAPVERRSPDFSRRSSQRAPSNLEAEPPSNIAVADEPQAVPET